MGPTWPHTLTALFIPRLHWWVPKCFWELAEPSENVFAPRSFSWLPFKRTKNKQGVLIAKGEPLFCSKRQALKKVNSLLSEFTHCSFQTRQSRDNLQSVLKFSFAGSGCLWSRTQTDPRPEDNIFFKDEQTWLWGFGRPTNSKQETENKTFTHIKATKIYLTLEFHTCVFRIRMDISIWLHKIKLDQ